MTTKSKVTHKVKVSKAKQWAKGIATRTHNMGWLAGACAILMIFIADAYFNAWMGALLGGSMLAILYTGIEFGMFYSLGEVATAFKHGVKGFRGQVRVAACLVAFGLGAICSYKALITYNAYWDARRGSDYMVADGLSEKHSFLAWQQILMFLTDNPDNAAKAGSTMSKDFDRRIEKEAAAREKLGYAPEFAVFYRGETLNGTDRDTLVHKRAADKASALRNQMTLFGIIIAVILTFVFITDHTVCDEDEVEAANDLRDDEDEAHLLNDHPKRPVPHVRVAAGSDVFTHKKPSFWQRLRGKAA